MGGLASLVAAANVTPRGHRCRQRLGPARFRGMDALETRAAAAGPGALPRCGRRRQRGLRLLEGRRGDARRYRPRRNKRLEALPGSPHGIGLMAGSARAKALVEGFLKGH